MLKQTYTSTSRQYNSGDQVEFNQNKSNTRRGGAFFKTLLRLSLRHPFHWFFLCWLGLIYIWAIQFLFGRYKQCSASPPIIGKGSAILSGASSCLNPNYTAAVLPIIVCSLLLLLYGLLLWISLSRKIAPRFVWLYLLMQGGLIFSIGLIAPDGNILLSLYLMFTLGVLRTFQQVRFPVIAGCGSLILFTLSSIVNITGGKQPDYWQTLIFTPTFDYVAPVLFVVGYLIIHIRQMQAHSQLQASHTELAIAHAQLEEAHTQLQASAQRIEELTLLTERQRIARELHDTLAQGVAGLIMQLEAANTQLDHQRFGQAKNIVQLAMTNARETLADARRAIEDIRTISSLIELSEAIQEEMKRLHNATCINCYADLACLSLIPVPLYEAVFRAIREGLTNVARYARASQVWIRVIRWQEEMLAIEIADNGVGFDTAMLANNPGHYGLIGVQERACLAGGVLEVNSIPGKGTLLRLLIPLHSGDNIK